MNQFLLGNRDDTSVVFTTKIFRKRMRRCDFHWSPSPRAMENQVQVRNIDETWILKMSLNHVDLLIICHHFPSYEDKL